MQFSLATAITTLLAAAALAAAAPGPKVPDFGLTPEKVRRDLADVVARGDLVVRDACDGMVACRAENAAVCSVWDAPWYDACMAVGCEFVTCFDFTLPCPWPSASSLRVRTSASAV